MASEWIWTLIAGAAAVMLGTLAGATSSSMVVAGAVVMILVLLALTGLIWGMKGKRDGHAHH